MPWRSRCLRSAWQLVQDLRQAVILNGGPEPGGDFPVRDGLAKGALEHFVSRARRVAYGSFEAKVAVFYWLSKCAQSSATEPHDLEELLRTFAQDVKKEALYGSERQLLQILRTLITARNRNKIQRALESDAQLQIDQLAAELLDSSSARLSRRHRHLSTSELSAFLSSYAYIWQPRYLPLFEALAPEVLRRLHGTKMTEKFLMSQTLPFILESYAKVRCTNQELFDASLSWFEATIDEHPYDSIGMVSYAVSVAGLHRPSLWRAVHREMCSGTWSLRAMGRVSSAFRRLALQGQEDDALLEVFKLASEVMMQRSDELTFHEASEMALGLAALDKEKLPHWQELKSCCCRAVARMEAPPIYLCHIFYALTALNLAGEDSELWEAQRCVSQALMPVFNVSLATELEVMAQALLALSQRATAEKLSSIGFRVLLLVAQREAVRKAKDLGATRAARLSCFLTAACEKWPPLLRPWFLPEMRAVAQTSCCYGQWLQEGAWPEGVTWYFQRSPNSVPILDVYGGPERLMGWDG